MRKVVILLVIMFLILNNIVFLSEDKIVKSNTTPPISVIDTDLIYEISKYLSFIINNTNIYPKGELAKGREFGSKGENASAIYLATQMANLDLYDPTNDSEYPYREKITNENYRVLGKQVLGVNLGCENLTRKIDVLAKRAIINNTVDYNQTHVVDCYIRPVTNGTHQSMSREKYLDYDMSLLTHNFSYTGLEIYNRTRLENLKWGFDEKFINETINETLANFSFFDNSSEVTLYEFMKPLFEDYYNFSFDTIDPNVNSTWPTFIEKNISNINITEPFVTIEENLDFNPKVYCPFVADLQLKYLRYYILIGSKQLADHTLE